MVIHSLKIWYSYIWIWWTFRNYGGFNFFQMIKIKKIFHNMYEKQKTCKHEGYSFKKHGRGCFDCGMILTDFGD